MNITVTTRLPLAALLSLAVTLTACGASAGTVPAPDAASSANASAGGGSTGSSAGASDQPYTCPSAQTSSGTLDCTKLPLGDHRYSTTAPRAGYIYACSTPSGSPVVSSAPWLGSTTWNATAKLAVEGSVTWNGSFSATVSGTTRTIASNGLPVSPIATGTFPIASTDPAYQYDRNPNHIAEQHLDFTAPEYPTLAASPSCLSGGPIGVALDGVAIYDGFDAAGYDAVAREIQDSCHGHPDQSDTYHYHGWLFACVTDAGSATQNSSLLGYAADGFGIYGPWYNGKILTSADLDECHGITSAVMWNGSLQSVYHYVSTYDFPYTLGCYRGTPARI